MTNFKVSIDIIKSGSPNDLPKQGSASECYITFAGINPDTDDISFRKTIFAKDIYNTKTIASFTEPEVDIQSQISSLDLAIPDSPTGLLITYSIYYGTRSIDMFIGNIINNIIGISIKSIKTSIPDIPYINIEDKLKKKLDAFEKKLKTKITNSANTSTETISIEKVIDASILLDGAEHIIPLTSDIESADDSIDDLFNYIDIGDHVANIIIKKQ